MKKTMVAFLFLFSQYSQALSVSAGLGLGSTEMKNESVETEGPFTQAFTVERLFHSKLSVGVEHIRSLTSTLVTSASFTGLLGRYYINAGPSKVYEPDILSMEESSLRDYSVFIGSGVGFAQSSRLPDNMGLSSNAAGVYLSPRAGVEMALTKQLGVRGEFIYATTLMGKGNLTQISLGSALYWIF